MLETFRKCLILRVFFSLLDIRKCNRRSRSKSINGNLKRKHKNKTFWTFAHLCKNLKSGRHQMLLKHSSLSIASLRKLDEETKKLYDRKHDFYQTALHTRCYIQHALHPYIDSEMNHIKHFIKITLINKGINFINLSSILRYIKIESSIPDYFENKEPPIIFYKYNKSIRRQYSISINLLLILQRLQIHEILKKIKTLL